jgi:hypothetical protein
MTTLATISIREAYGIRRFLYPLNAKFELPSGCPTTGLGLRRPDGQPVPLQVTPDEGGGEGAVRLDFALSMAPFEELELLILDCAPDETPDDPLRITAAARFRSEQRRFSIEFDRAGRLHHATYDGREHLRDRSVLTRNGESATAVGSSSFASGPLAARMSAGGQYSDGCRFLTDLEITAYKSWVALRHTLGRTQGDEEVSFVLPLAVSSPAVACDFGAGGGLYGRIQTGSAPEVVWRTDFPDTGGAHFSLSTAGRIDYEGTTRAGAEGGSQRWFHLIDRDKALAVAITQVPPRCRSMLVTLRESGDVIVSFQMADSLAGQAVFGLCYHFLNDIPAIAAATNPQSILLPPVVEVTGVSRKSSLS